jgi:hypothetical protein
MRLFKIFAYFNTKVQEDFILINTAEKSVKVLTH